MWALLRKNCQCDNVFPLNDVVPFPLLPETFYRWFKRGRKKVATISIGRPRRLPLFLHITHNFIA